MNVEEVLMFLAISVVSVFSFASIAVWVEGRRKEREAYYKAESMRRIAEMPGDAAKNVIEVMREEERIHKGRELAAVARKREGLIIGGLVNIGIGFGIMVFLYFLTMDHKDGPAHVYLSGLIMVFIGLPLLLYGLWMKPRTPTP
jgi:hypothetical protein